MSSSDRRRAWRTVAAFGLLATAGGHAAELDLAALEVLPERGQSADQARRDRYECHNWAVDQTGVVPLRPPLGGDDDRKERRRETLARVLNGAAIGAGLGGLIRAVQDRDPDNGVLAGAAVGAAVGAATARARDRQELDAESSEYLRALTACLEGRGYRVALPAAEDGEQAQTVAGLFAARTAR